VSLPGRALNACRKVTRRFQGLNRRLFREFSHPVRGSDVVLRNALKEAEALAWETPYPHLVLPLLAEEKARAARRWAARQQLIRESTWNLRFAA